MIMCAVVGENIQTTVSQFCYYLYVIMLVAYDPYAYRSEVEWIFEHICSWTCLDKIGGIARRNQWLKDGSEGLCDKILGIFVFLETS